MATKIQKAFKDKFGLDISKLDPKNVEFDIWTSEDHASVAVRVTEVKLYALGWHLIDEYEND